MNPSTVDPVKCPRLHAALRREVEARQGGWAKVAELRRAGDLDAADRLVRRLLGVQGAPMSEETKEKLREYTEAHKDEIRDRRKHERDVQRRTRALLVTGGKRR
jgi:CHASE3 domain sensor protein